MGDQSQFEQQPVINPGVEESLCSIYICTYYMHTNVNIHKYTYIDKCKYKNVNIPLVYANVNILLVLYIGNIQFC